MANQEQVERLTHSVDEWNQWRQQQSGFRPDLSRADLTETNLFRANLSRAELFEARIPETYTWLLVPDQPDPKKPDELQELKLQPQPQSSLAANASRRLKTEEMLITQYAGTLLRREMDRIPLWRGNHVGIKDLADYFARYVYLPRLKNTQVLLGAIREGAQALPWSESGSAGEYHPQYGNAVGQTGGCGCTDSRGDGPSGTSSTTCNTRNHHDLSTGTKSAQSTH